MKFHPPTIKLSPPNLVYVRQSWWKILALGILLAIGISLLTTAYCVLADCGVKDKWCNGDCSQTCGPTGGLGVVVGCSRGAYGCIEDWIPDSWGMNFTNSNDCKVTNCASSPPGYGCYLAGDGRWDVGACSAFPSCRRVTRISNETCCGNSGAPMPCPESGPTITTASLQPTPEYPLVLYQDPYRRGITISGITITAGEHDSAPGRSLPSRSASA